MIMAMSEMLETIEINFMRPIPVFPLPGCVLLPHGAVPLHIFEARYRRMAKDALDGFGLIAMGLFEGRVSEAEYGSGRPPLRPHVCVGHIEQYKPLEDGRYMLLLRGLCRARVVQEIEHEPYRMFQLEPTDLQQDPERKFMEHRKRLEELLGDPLMKNVQGVEEIGSLLSQEDEIPTPALVDIVAMQVCDDAEQRYPILAENNAQRRCVALTAHLKSLRNRLGA